MHRQDKNRLPLARRPDGHTSPQGRFTLQIFGAVAEFERALVRERAIGGIRTAVTINGKEPGNPGLWHWDATAIRKRDNDDLLTVVAGIVKGMRRRNEEPTLAAIDKTLGDMHQRTPRGGSRWSRSSFKNLLDRALEQKYIDNDSGALV